MSTHYTAWTWWRPAAFIRQPSGLWLCVCCHVLQDGRGFGLDVVKYIYGSTQYMSLTLSFWWRKLQSLPEGCTGGSSAWLGRKPSGPAFESSRRGCAACGIISTHLNNAAMTHALAQGPAANRVVSLWNHCLSIPPSLSFSLSFTFRLFSLSLLSFTDALICSLK